jgi:hypothetical protein
MIHGERQWQAAQVREPLKDCDDTRVGDRGVDFQG